MASFTLDDIKAAADRKYASTEIDLGGFTVELLNPLRLEDEKRDALFALQDVMDDEDTDQRKALEDALRLIVAKPIQGDKLIEALGGDLALLATVFQTWTEQTQAGEA